jgi:hypothetical protein
MVWDLLLLRRTATQKEIRYEPYVHIHLYRYYIPSAFAIVGYHEIDPVF